MGWFDWLLGKPKGTGFPSISPRPSPPVARIPSIAPADDGIGDDIARW